MTRTKRVRTLIRAASLALLSASLGAVACGGPSGGGGGCRYESWTGRCRLTNVRTVRVVERFPKSYVVVEALYEPQSAGGAFPPPPFRRELMGLAESEAALIAHLQSHADVECAVQNPVGDPCAPQMMANVPEFAAASASAPSGPVGCAKIEQGGGNLPPSGVSMPGPFQFELNSAGESADALRLADEAAQTLRADPRIECVAIKAKTAPGESFSLANERAQAVRRLLEARGVERARVTIFEAQAPTHTAAPDADQPDPVEQRRVHLTIVVYGK